MEIMKQIIDKQKRKLRKPKLRILREDQQNGTYTKTDKGKRRLNLLKSERKIGHYQQCCKYKNIAWE